MKRTGLGLAEDNPVAIMLTSEAAQQRRNEKRELHLKIPDLNKVGDFWQANGEERSISGYNLPISPEENPLNSYNPLICQLRYPSEVREQMTSLDELRDRYHVT